MRTALVAVLLLCLAPGAVALDLVPTETRLGEHEARLLLRVAPGAALDVRADPPVEASWAAPGDAPAAALPTPARLEVRAGAWHGLDGMVEVILRRDDPTQAVALEVEDGSAVGIALDWPAAARDVPLPGALVVAAALVALLPPTRRGRRT